MSKTKRQKPRGKARICPNCDSFWMGSCYHPDNDIRQKARKYIPEGFHCKEWRRTP